MVHQYRNPSVKFIANKDNFNKLLSVLTFQEDNIVSQDWIDKVKNLKDILLRYSVDFNAGSVYTNRATGYRMARLSTTF